MTVCSSRPELTPCSCDAHGAIAPAPLRDLSLTQTQVTHLLVRRFPVSESCPCGVRLLTRLLWSRKHRRFKAAGGRASACPCATAIICTILTGVSFSLTCYRPGCAVGCRRPPSRLPCRSVPPSSSRRMVIREKCSHVARKVALRQKSSRPRSLCFLPPTPDRASRGRKRSSGSRSRTRCHAESSGLLIHLLP